jgi:hypothetical protein
MSEEKPYDSTQDVMEHKERVEYWVRNFTTLLQRRAESHDNSKLGGFEKATFDLWVPNLKRVEFGSDEYKKALGEMGVGLEHHYAENRHHPEHYENGINGMTLTDLVEMVCDWMAAAQAKGNFIDLDYLAKRFGISEQLIDIFANTLREDDIWNEINGVPTVHFCPPNRQEGHVEGFERTSHD